MAIEVSSRVQKEKKASVMNIIFWLVLVLFIASAAGYYFLNSSEKNMAKELSDNKAKIQKTPDELALEKEIFGSDNSIGYEQEITDYSSLLESHKFPLNFLNFLEENTLPKVWFSSFSLNLQNNTLQMVGSADNFEILGQQSLIFEQQNFIKDVNLSTASMDKEGKVDFSLQLTLDPKIFK